MFLFFSQKKKKKTTCFFYIHLWLPLVSVSSPSMATSNSVFLWWFQYVNSWSRAEEPHRMRGRRFCRHVVLKINGVTWCSKLVCCGGLVMVDFFIQRSCWICGLQFGIDVSWGLRNWCRGITFKPPSFSFPFFIFLSIPSCEVCFLAEMGWV